MKIENLSLSARATNALRRAGIRNTEQLMSMAPEDLRRIRSVGEKTVDEIMKTIEVVKGLERESQEAPAPHGSYLHGFNEGKESMRWAVIREMTRFSRRLPGEQQEAISEACAMVKMIEVL